MKTLVAFSPLIFFVIIAAVIVVIGWRIYKHLKSNK